MPVTKQGITHKLEPGIAGAPASAMLSVVLIADILLNQDFVIWVIAPPVASLSVLIAGLLSRRYWPRAGRVMLLVGLVGLVLSAAWIAFGFYVDAVLGDT